MNEGKSTILPRRGDDFIAGQLDSAHKFEFVRHLVPGFASCVHGWRLIEYENRQYEA